MVVLNKNLKNDKEKLNFITIEYHDPEEIYFPNLCMICGNNTENRLKKSYYTSYSPTRDYKKDYHFDFPVCQECHDKIHMKSGISSKSGKLLFLSTFFGVILGILLYFILYSIILSISIAAISFIFPYIHYRNKMKIKIKLNDFLTVNVNDREDSIKLNIKNYNYVDLLDEIKLQKEKENKNKRLSEEQIKSIDLKDKKLSEKESKETMDTEEDMSKIVNEISASNTNGLILDRCPKCKNPITPDMTYCINCGAVLK